MTQVQCTIDGEVVQVVDTTINGSEIYILYVASGELRMKKVFTGYPGTNENTVVIGTSATIV